MLLRSSSTPVLGSLLSSFSDSPNNSSFDHNRPPSDHLKRLSFSNSNHPNFHFFSSNSSPTPVSFSPTPDVNPEPKGFRRARSDGNLEGLAFHEDDFHNWVPPKSSRRPNSVLQTIPSFSVYRSRENDYYGEEEDEEEEEFGLPRSVTIGENITSMGGDLTFSDERRFGSFGVDEENGTEAPPLFLARGLGIDTSNPSNFMTGDGGGRGRSDFALVDAGGGGDGSDVESYYKRMVEEDPCNPLFLRNYAQYLYQSKGDSARAEEYYSRAILAGPGDGEILLQYAKIIWERHRDRERASTYFEQAVQAAPDDSHVLAAYASFLWEEEDEEGEEEDTGSHSFLGMPVFHGSIASASG